MVIILMTIGGYFIGGYWWLLIGIILVAISGYFIGGYWWLLIGTILVAISGYFIGGYWWSLIGIILVVICGYFINGYCIISYCWVLYVILQLLVIIILHTHTHILYNHDFLLVFWWKFLISWSFWNNQNLELVNKIKFPPNFDIDPKLGKLHSKTNDKNEKMKKGKKDYSQIIT